MILFHIFISGLADQTECFFSRFAGDDGVEENVPNDSKTPSHKELGKLEPGAKRNLMMFKTETTQYPGHETFKLYTWLQQKDHGQHIRI